MTFLTENSMANNWQERPFRTYLILSAVIHFLVIFPWPFLRLLSRHEISFKKLELTYYRDSLTREIMVKELNPVTSLANENDNIGFETEKNSISIAKVDELEIDFKENTAIEVGQKQADDISKRPQEPIEKKNDSLEANEEGEIVRLDYYLKVREKIKSVLEKTKSRFEQGGEVYVKFAIDRNGALRDLASYKTVGEDGHLFETIALESIRQASPFPPFDKKINDKEILFKLPIKFTCD